MPEMPAAPLARKAAILPVLLRPWQGGADSLPAAQLLDSANQAGKFADGSGCADATTCLNA